MTTIAPTVEEAATGHGYISDKNRYLARLKRIEGQTHGIHRMIDGADAGTGDRFGFLFRPLVSAPA